MNETVKVIKVRGYNKTHEFRIERWSTCGHDFVRLMKNNTIVLNCKPAEFEKFRGLFQ